MNNDLPIIVLDSNENSRNIIKSYIEEFGYGENGFYLEDYNLGLEEIKKNCDKNPIVFIDISEMNSPILNILESIKLLTTRIVITSTESSIDMIVKAMRYGAKEFLPKPILKNDLQRVLTLLTQQNLEIQKTSSKIISVYSNKGGIGKTTIATNLAVELAKSTRDKVLLVDLNLQLGDISTFLNLNPTVDVSYFIKNLLDKKEETILNACERYKDTSLFILSDPTYIEQAESITLQQIDKLLTVLKKVFSYIIVDMSSNIDPNSLKILDKSDWILFTTIVNIPAIRNAQRCLNLFKSRRYSEDKVKIIVNRYMENDDITIEDIETALQEKVYWKIPNNYFSIMEAINRGIPVCEVNSNSNIANSFKSLVAKISDDIVIQAIRNSGGN